MATKGAHHGLDEGAHEREQTIIYNTGAQGVGFFTPAQNPPAGTATDPQPNGAKIPKLFQPLKIRGVTFQNRIMLSPLCQYSADDGHHTAWHLTHLGGIIQRGPGLAMVEATSVTANGRITPEDSGLWKDSQIEPLRKIVEFAHSQGQKIGIQLAHAGRKASTVAPWLSRGDTASKEVGGWPDNVWAPSTVPFNDRFPVPIAMTKAHIEEFKTAWVAAVKRALAAGFDVIEVHAAHGYLFSSFTSPNANQRTDEYGGSFENRTRLLMEIVELTRKNIPDGMPLFLRISASEWIEEAEPQTPSWKSEDTVRLAEMLVGKIDLLDVSSGGMHTNQQIKVLPGAAYQEHFAKAVKEKVGDKLLVGCVGGIKTGKLANQVLEDGLDLAIIGRMFQKNPGLVFAFADELGVDVRMPHQIRWGFVRKDTNPKKE